jgi:ribonuclease D
MLTSEFGLEIDKKHQRANWGRRPLTPSMLIYARLDTHYLLDLRDALNAELEAKNLLALAEEDFHRLCQTPAAPLAAQVDTCWSIATPKDVDPQQAAILQELCAYRDRQARYTNQPTFRILPNRILIDIAVKAPLTLQELEKVPELPGRTVERYGAGLISAIERGKAAAPRYPPRSSRPTDSLLRRLDALREWRKETARPLSVESDVVLPKDTLIAIAETNPHSLEELAQVMGALPWRFEQYGQDILNVLMQKGKKNV